MTLAPPEVETVIINGFTFSYRRRFAPGHVCTQAEAAVLNQQLKKNLRRNFAANVPNTPAYIDESVSNEIFDNFREYESTYAFGGPDPIHAEAFVIALEITKRKLKVEGKLVSDYSRGQLSSLAEEVLDGPRREAILEVARQRVVTIQAAAAREARRDSNGGE